MTRRTLRSDGDWKGAAKRLKRSGGGEGTNGRNSKRLTAYKKSVTPEQKAEQEDSA